MDIQSHVLTVSKLETRLESKHFFLNPYRNTFVEALLCYRMTECVSRCGVSCSGVTGSHDSPVRLAKSCICPMHSTASQFLLTSTCTKRHGPMFCIEHQEFIGNKRLVFPSTPRHSHTSRQLMLPHTSNNLRMTPREGVHVCRAPVGAMKTEGISRTT